MDYIEEALYAYKNKVRYIYEYRISFQHCFIHCQFYTHTHIETVYYSVFSVSLFSAD
mgnify:CR=1 FL=1